MYELNVPVSSHTTTTVLCDAAGASPSFDQASYAVSVDENAAAGTTLTTNYVVTDADLPSDTLTYSLSGQCHVSSVVHTSVKPLSSQVSRHRDNVYN